MGGFFQQANDAAIAQSARDSVALAATPPVATGGSAADIAGRIEEQAFQPAQKAIIAEANQNCILVDTFGDAARWSATAGCELTADTANIYYGAGLDFRESGVWTPTTFQTAKIEKTVNDSKVTKIAATLSSPINATGIAPRLEFVLDASTQTLAQAYVWLRDSANKYKYWSWVRSGMGDHIGSYDVARITGADNGIDLTDVVKIELEFRTVNDTDDLIVSPCRLRLVKLWDGPAKPIILRLDGCYAAHDELMTYAAALGLKMTQYATYDRVGEPARMTLSQLLSQQSAGHFISIHERATEPTGFNSMTLAQKRQSVQEGNRWLAANGFSRSVGTFCTLRGEWRHALDWENLSDILYHCAVSMHPGGKGEGANQIPGRGAQLGVTFDSNSIAGSDQDEKLATAISELSAEANEGRTLCPLFHDLTDTSAGLSLASAKSVLDYVAAEQSAGRLEVVTPPELIRGELQRRWYSS